MAKITQIAKYLTSVYAELEPEEIDAKPLYTGFDVCHCEDCGRKVTHLVLSKEGFFHCEPCEFMHVRRVAVQEFDND